MGHHRERPCALFFAKKHGYAYLQANGQSIECWKSLPINIDRLLGIWDAIFYPEKHNKLIRDDDLLSRSRMYFWVINCILESDNLIRPSIKAWKEYRDDVLLPYGERMNLRGKYSLEAELYKYIERCDTVCGELENIQQLLEEQREKAMVLETGYGSTRSTSS